MAFDDDINQALTDIYDCGGRGAVFTPLGGDPVSCKIMIAKDVELQPDGMGAEAWERKTVIECIINQVGKIPEAGETFTVNSIVRTVDSLVETIDDRLAVLTAK